MSAAVVEIAGGKSVFAPGETLHGTAQWEFDGPADDVAAVEVRLIWFTSGKGTQDVEIVSRVAFATPPRSGQRPFTFNLPDSPHSFSGRLISLTWALELVAGEESARAEFVLSPFGAEIDLTAGAASDATPRDDGGPS